MLLEYTFPYSSTNITLRRKSNRIDWTICYKSPTQFTTSFSKSKFYNVHSKRLDLLSSSYSPPSSLEFTRPYLFLNLNTLPKVQSNRLDHPLYIVPIHFTTPISKSKYYNVQSKQVDLLFSSYSSLSPLQSIIPYSFSYLTLRRKSNRIDWTIRYISPIQFTSQISILIFHRVQSQRLDSL